MGLAQSIVIKNEFTYKPKGSSGTRGKTPGNYVLGYMAREGAGEAVTPVRMLDADEYIVRYMARDEATESAGSVEELKGDMKEAQGWGGQAFGYGSLSLSHEGLKAASRDIQNQFDNGKTVLKTVLSFDARYLKDNGVVDPSFVYRRPGDWRGRIDQMKLRTAIAAGLSRLDNTYDDLRWVGVIQVDTAHVHCHLAMVDAGEGNVRPDGSQTGKLSAFQKKALRRGIDMALDEAQTVRHLSADVAQDQRNALCFIKKFTHQTMDQHGLPQFLLSCLPADERLWRAGTNRAEMRKPNAIVREYVNQVLSQPGSGYQDALRSIRAYASGRQEREGLSVADEQALYNNGREQLVKDCMNGVYSVLKSVPHAERQVRTPMLEIMSEDYTALAAKAQSGADDMVEFGFKLRSYSTRLDHHKKESAKYHEAAEAYKAVPNPAPESRPLLAFFEFEEEYNAKLMCKYQYFLDFLPPDDAWADEFKELMDYRGRMTDLERMLNDPSVRRMLPDNAERYGLDVYQQHGGSLVRNSPEILERRLEKMGETYERRESDFKRRLAQDGLTLEQTERGMAVSRKKPYDFDEVKALDIHHLSYDFAYDIAVSRVNADRFIEAAKERRALYEGAKSYLERTGQIDFLKTLPGRDIRIMSEMAQKLDADAVLPRARMEQQFPARRGRTFRLDRDFDTDMKMAVQATVNAVAELNRQELN